MGSSTGGTISGVGKYLIKKNSKAIIVLIDPVGSVLKGYFENVRIIEEDSKSYLVEGVGKNNIPWCFNPKLVDFAMSATDD